VGDDVVAVGNALDLGRTMTVTRGIISAQGREIDTKQGTFSGLLQTDAAMSSGISGGALVDSTGAVIGMTSAAALRKTGTTVQNIGFAIPSNVVLEVIAGFEVVAR
jgi:S1-C subfamily serine protease